MPKIYDELSYAEELIKNSLIEVNTLTPLRDLNILAKYYRYLGHKDSGIRKLILEYCKNKYKSFNEILYYDKIEQVIKKSKKQSIRRKIDVPITKRECDEIRKLNNFRYEKIIFTMLVIGKYYKLTSDYKDDSNIYYYLTSKLTNLYRLSKVEQKKGENIAYTLFSLGYIIDGRKNNSLKLLFTDTTKQSEEIEIIVTDMENIYKFWLPRCKKCGNMIENKSSRQLYCKSCEKENHAEVMRKSREKLKNGDL